MLRSFRRYLGLDHPAAPARPNTKGNLAVEALEDRWMPSTGMSPWADLGAGIIVPPAAVTTTTQAATTPSTPPTITPPTANATPVAIAAPTATPTPTPSPVPAVAQPQTLEVDATFAQAATDSDQTQSVAQFNPALGTLTGVQIVQQSTLTSDVRVENLGSTAAPVSGTVQGTLNLHVGGVTTVVSRPGLQESAQLGAYDGSTDATDSVDFGAQSALDTRSVMLSSSSNDLSAFVGTGTVSLAECAAATASISGPGNVAGQANTTAGSTVRIIYYYTPSTTPTPTTSGGDSGCSGMTTPTPPTTTPPTTTPPTTTPPTTTPPTTTPVTNGSLAGVVYLDNNNNGVMDSGDGALSGVAVTLQGSGATAGTSKTATTDINGEYQFSGLPAGNYTITETQPLGFQQGTNNVGSLGGSVSGDVFSLALASGQVGTNYNFGEILTPTTPSTPTPNTTTPPPATPPPATTPPTTSGDSCTPPTPSTPPPVTPPTTNTCTPPTPPPTPSTPPPVSTPPPTTNPCPPPPPTNVTPPPAPTPPPTTNTTPPPDSCTPPPMNCPPPPPPDTCTPPPPPTPTPPPTPSTPPPVPLAPPPVPLTPPATPTPPPPPGASAPSPPDPVLTKRMFIGNSWESL